MRIVEREEIIFNFSAEDERGTLTNTPVNPILEWEQLKTVIGSKFGIRYKVFENLVLRVVTPKLDLVALALALQNSRCGTYTTGASASRRASLNAVDSSPLASKPSLAVR